MKNSVMKASAGQRGDKVRSDCYIEIELKKTGRLELNIQSKVASMYGRTLKDDILKMCRFFNIRHALVTVEDNGALPFVVAARFEAAYRRINPSLDKEYLLPFNKKNQYGTGKEKLRRSRLYLPGNEPKFFVNAGLHAPDAVILDLEDSVAHSEKDAAQMMVRNALRAVDFYGAERMVRINQLPKGIEDLKYIIPHNVNVILIPKCESPEQIKEVETEVKRLKEVYKIKNEVYFMPILESALGIINAFSIASASENNCALAIGLEDYTADIGTPRTPEGRESFFARTMLINAAKATGIQAIDTVFSDVNDMEGLRQSVVEAKALGFEGKGCIHPRQIQVVHDAFAPTPDEIEKARKIVLAFEDAEKKGLGVVSLGSKMIDAPVVKRAHKIVKLALLNRLIEEDWRNEG